MKYKHYAPKADVTILKGSFDAYRDYIAAHAGDGVWALCFDGEEAQLPVPAISYGKEGTASAKRTTCSPCCGNWTAKCQNRLCPLPAQRWRFHGRV